MHRVSARLFGINRLKQRYRWPVTPADYQSFLQYTRSLWRRASASWQARRREYLFWELQSALCLLSELPNFPNTQTALKNEVSHERLAEMMLELQERGCHNINFVSRLIWRRRWRASILIAAEQGLRVPIVLQHQTHTTQFQFCNCLKTSSTCICQT